MNENIFQYIQEGDINSIEKYSQVNNDINDKEQGNGNTLLNWAVLYDQPDIVKLLLEKGADINIHNKKWEKPYYVAVLYKRKEIIPLLEPLISKECSLNLTIGSSIPVEERPNKMLKNTKNKLYLDNTYDPINNMFVHKIFEWKITKIGRKKRHLVWQYYRDRNRLSVSEFYRNNFYRNKRNVSIIFYGKADIYTMVLEKEMADMLKDRKNIIGYEM